jgi:hypothetical protein
VSGKTVAPQGNDAVLGDATARSNRWAVASFTRKGAYNEVFYAAATAHRADAAISFRLARLLLRIKLPCKAVP